MGNAKDTGEFVVFPEVADSPNGVFTLGDNDFFADDDTADDLDIEVDEDPNDDNWDDWDLDLI